MQLVACRALVDEEGHSSSSWPTSSRPSDPPRFGSCLELITLAGHLIEQIKTCLVKVLRVKENYLINCYFVRRNKKVKSVAPWWTQIPLVVPRDSLGKERESKIGILYPLLHGSSMQGNIRR